MPYPGEVACCAARVAPSLPVSRPHKAGGGHHIPHTMRGPACLRRPGAVPHVTTSTANGGPQTGLRLSRNAGAQAPPRIGVSAIIGRPGPMPHPGEAAGRAARMGPRAGGQTAERPHKAPIRSFTLQPHKAIGGYQIPRAARGPVWLGRPGTVPLLAASAASGVFRGSQRRRAPGTVLGAA